MYIPSTAPEHNELNSVAEIRAHFRRSRKGKVGAVRRHQRMVAMTEAPEGTGDIWQYKRVSGGFSSEMLDEARAGPVGTVVANGPWEVQKAPGGDLVLYHYAWPLARYHSGSMSAVPRTGYGFSVTDMGAVRDMFYHLIAGPKNLSYSAAEKMMPNLRQTKFTPWVYTGGYWRSGYEVDNAGKIHRIDTLPPGHGEAVALKAGGGPSRMSPYAIIARESGEHGFHPETRPFPSRRFPTQRRRRA